MLVAGASVRAASTSIRRAGLRPIAVDLFADLDLAATAEVYRVDLSDYPAGIAARVAGLPPTPWMYTGALENHPDLVAEVSRRHPLCSVGPESLRAVRDPDQLAWVAKPIGFPMPETQRQPPGRHPDAGWLIKPIASGGGRGITRWLGGEPPDPASAFVWQRRLEGISRSAVFLGDGLHAELVGVTRQTLGFAGAPYAYAGSTGPDAIPESGRAALGNLGRALARGFGLRGLFGVDLVFFGGRQWVIEVNPRYTASVEVLELTLGRSLVAEHLARFGVAAPGADLPGPSSANPVVAKLILAARRAGTLAEPVPSRIPPTMPAHRRGGPPPEPITSGTLAGLWDVPDAADIPRVGTRFEVGDPILTIFGRGRTLFECNRDLQRRTWAWRAWLEGEGSRPGAIRPES